MSTSIKELIERDQKNNREKITCYRCGGKGYLSQYWYIDGGVCFRCNGSGFEQ